MKEVFEDIAGFDLADADASANFIELGLDSLMLTQVALQLQKTFGVKVSFRQLMGECGSLDKLAAMLDDAVAAGSRGRRACRADAAPAPAATPSRQPRRCRSAMMPMPAFAAASRDGGRRRLRAAA